MKFRHFILISCFVILNLINWKGFLILNEKPRKCVLKVLKFILIMFNVGSLLYSLILQFVYILEFLDEFINISKIWDSMYTINFIGFLFYMLKNWKISKIYWLAIKYVFFLFLRFASLSTEQNVIIAYTLHKKRYHKNELINFLSSSSCLMSWW